MTKAQADQLNQGRVVQADYIKQLKKKYDELKTANLDLTKVVEDSRSELNQATLYNDSLLSRLGDNMALLYKTSSSSKVFYVNLRHYTVDVYPKGSIMLNSTDQREQSKIEQRLELYPNWRYIDIANQFEPARRNVIGYIQLYPKQPIQ